MGLQQTGLLSILMPRLSEALQPDERRVRMERVFSAIDEETSKRREVSPAVLFLATHLELVPEDSVRDFAKIRNVLIALFENVGVTRREREQMEQIMITAMKLFDATGKNQRTLTTKPHFEDALLLIHLTAANEDGFECVRFWRKQAPTLRGANARGGQVRGGRRGGDGQPPRRRGRRQPRV